MKARHLKYTLTLLAGLMACATSALAAEPTLKVGDPAPRLQTGKWVQGEAVKEFEKGKAYIVEFWATWCGPCRTSIPHLNEIHVKFKDKGLVVIGQDCWERDESQVEPFIKSMGDKMTYRVALDDKRGSEQGTMAETWMAAAGQNGIPSAFLVDKQGMIAWIGHPMSLKESTIEAVLAGTFDVRKAAEEYITRQKNEALLENVWGGLQEAMGQGDWNAVNARLAEAEKLLPSDQVASLETVRFEVAVRRKDFTAAHQVAARISEANKDEAMLQNALAWQMLVDERIEKRDLPLAETIAQRANDASNGEDPAILDTLARAKFMLGKRDEAIALQEKAVRLSEGGMKVELQRVLDSYRKGELPKAE